MLVSGSLVGMRVRVRFAPDVRLDVIVLMMCVMGVAVLMDDTLVRVHVLMMLGQV